MLTLLTVELQIRQDGLIVPKSIVYSEPAKSTEMYLTEGDIITVLEEENDWIKMEYAGEMLITGWIKKKDAK